MLPAELWPGSLSHPSHQHPLLPTGHPSYPRLETLSGRFTWELAEFLGKTCPRHTYLPRQPLPTCLREGIHAHHVKLGHPKGAGKNIDNKSRPKVYLSMPFKTYSPSRPGSMRRLHPQPCSLTASLSSAVGEGPGSSNIQAKSLNPLTALARPSAWLIRNSLSLE